MNRLIPQLISLNIQIEKKKEIQENWRRNQKCSFYENSSQRTRERLEEGRRQTKNELVLLEDERSNTLKELLSLPDIPSRSRHFLNYEVDQQKVIDYAKGIQSWIEALHIASRLSAAGVEHTGPGDPNSMDADRPPISIVESLRQKENISANDLQSAIDSLQSRLLPFEEERFPTIVELVDVQQLAQELRGVVRNRIREKTLVEMDLEKQQQKHLNNQLQLGETERRRTQERQDNFVAQIADIRARTAALEKVNKEVGFSSLVHRMCSDETP